MQVRKSHYNTSWTAERIAGLANVDTAVIGYCGTMDRRVRTPAVVQHTVVQQASSCGSQPDSRAVRHCAMNATNASCVACKLRRGMRPAHRFVVRLRDLGDRRQRMDR